MSFGGFGVSIGDAFAVGNLAWKVYKACRNAPEEFKQLSSEVASLHTVLNEISDEQRNPDSVLNRSKPWKKKTLDQLLQSCRFVLNELDLLLAKHRSLGSGRSKNWDRIQFGAKDVKSIREKLALYNSTISLFLMSLETGALRRIENRLDQLAQDVQSGRRESKIFVHDEEHIPEDFLWNDLEAELQRDDISSQELNAHKNGILAYARELTDKYGFNAPSEPPNEIAHTDPGNQNSTISLPYLKELSKHNSPDIYHNELSLTHRQIRLEQFPGSLNGPPARPSSTNSDIITDTQEYDDQGRLRKRTIIRQSTGSSLNSSSTAYSRLYSLFPQTTPVKPDLAGFRRLADNPDAFRGSHQILDKPDLAKPANLEKDLPYLSSTLSNIEKAELFQSIHECLCRSAFDFAAQWQLPIPLEPDRKPVSAPEDREWIEWIDLLKGLAKSKNIPPRALHGRRIQDLNQVLERAQMSVHISRFEPTWPGGDRYVLQLLSASTQVAYLLKDARAVNDLDSMYSSTEVLIQERQRATESWGIRERGSNLKTRLNSYLGNIKHSSSMR